LRSLSHRFLFIGPVTGFNGPYIFFSSPFFLAFPNFHFMCVNLSFVPPLITRFASQCHRFRFSPWPFPNGSFVQKSYASIVHGPIGLSQFPPFSFFFSIFPPCSRVSSEGVAWCPPWPTHPTVSACFPPFPCFYRSPKLRHFPSSPLCTLPSFFPVFFFHLSAPQKYFSWTSCAGSPTVPLALVPTLFFCHSFCLEFLFLVEPPSVAWRGFCCSLNFSLTNHRLFLFVPPLPLVQLFLPVRHNNV